MQQRLAEFIPERQRVQRVKGRREITCNMFLFLGKTRVDKTFGFKKIHVANRKEFLGNVVTSLKHTHKEIV